ncbi:hypothetical protein Tco_0044038 [Tanacetum coccineum]
MELVLLVKAADLEIRDPRDNGVGKFSEQCVGKVSHAQARRVPIPVIAPEFGPSIALKMTVPSTAEEKICKKNDVKARSLLLMALYDRKFGHSMMELRSLIS